MTTTRAVAARPSRYRSLVRARNLSVAVAALGVVGALTASAANPGVGTVAAGSSTSGPIRAAAEPSSPDGLPGDAELAEPSELPPNSTVTLPTGDRVHLAVTGGEQNATVVPASAADGGELSPSTFVQFTLRGDLYVVPSVAMPYLSSTLDPRLFNVSYLARAELDDENSDTLPVTIDASSGEAADLPAVKIQGGSSGTGDSAKATIKKEHASALGELLADQWRSSRAGDSSVPVGQLADVSRISLAPPASAPELPAAPSLSQPVTPADVTGTATQGNSSSNSNKGQPFHTLTVDVTDRTGQPGAATVIVQNVGEDDPYPGLSMLFGVVQGTATISVPAGTYSIAASVVSPRPSSSEFDSALVVQPQITIDSDQTVALDARTAEPYEVTLELDADDAPAFRQDMLSYTRTSASGDRFGIHGAGMLQMRLLSVSPNPFPGFLPSGLWASPTAEVTAGVFGFNAYSMYTDRHLFGVDVQEEPTYLLSFPHESRIPSSLTYSVPRADLTTVRQTLYDNSGASSPRIVSNWGAAFSFGFGVHGGNRTDYWYSSDPGLEVWELRADHGDGLSILRSGARRTITPGQEIQEIWTKDPFVPSPAAPPADWLHWADPNWTNEPLPGPRWTVCAACRQDDIGMFYLAPLGDSDPSHYSLHRMTKVSYPGNKLGVRSDFRFFRNGELAVDTSAELSPFSAVPFQQPLPLLPEPATYQLEWSVTDADLASSNTTVWTFHSSRADPPAAAPRQWCAPVIDRECSFLPLLFVNYDLALNLDSLAPADSPFDIVFNVTHQQNQEPPTGLTATVSASYDDGDTWTDPQPATRQGDGPFTTTIQHPPLGETSGHVSLRVHAQDGAGNAVDQTIIRAYQLTD